MGNGRFMSGLRSGWSLPGKTPLLHLSETGFCLLPCTLRRTLPIPERGRLLSESLGSLSPGSSAGAGQCGSLESAPQMIPWPAGWNVPLRMFLRWLFLHRGRGQERPCTFLKRDTESEPSPGALSREEGEMRAGTWGCPRREYPQSIISQLGAAQASGTPPIGWLWSGLQSGALAQKRNCVLGAG